MNKEVRFEKRKGQLVFSLVALLILINVSFISAPGYNNQETIKCSDILFNTGIGASQICDGIDSNSGGTISWGDAINGTLMLASNWNSTNTSYFDLNKANTAGDFNQTFDTNTLFIDATGNAVGIGTTATGGYKLKIAGSTSQSSGTQFDFGAGNSRIIDGGTNYNMQFAVWNGATVSEVMRLVGSSGNVGINTTSPFATLHVNSSNASGSLRISNRTMTHLFVNGSTGYVGIGVTAPTTALVVNGTIISASPTYGLGYPVSAFQSLGTYGGAYDRSAFSNGAYWDDTKQLWVENNAGYGANAILWDNLQDTEFIRVAGNATHTPSNFTDGTKMRLKADGKLELYAPDLTTNQTDWDLFVSGGVNSGNNQSVGIKLAHAKTTSTGLWAGIKTVSTSDWSGTIDLAFLTGVNAQKERMRITNGGYVGINTTTPAYFFQVGNGSATNYSLISAYFEGNVSSAGYITRTSVYDKTQGSALNFIKDASNLTTAGKVNDSKFYGYTTWTTKETDYSKPVTAPENICYSGEAGNEVCKIEMVTKYPYQIDIKHEGVSLDKEIDVLRQAVYELKVQNKEMQVELCNIGVLKYC